MRQNRENLMKGNGSELIVGDPHLEVILQHPRRGFIVVDVEGCGPVQLTRLVTGFFGMVGLFFGIAMFGTGNLLFLIAGLAGLGVGGYVAGLGAYFRHTLPLHREIEKVTGAKIPHQSLPGFKKSYDGTMELNLLLPYEVDSSPEFKGVTVFSDDKLIYLIKNTYYHYDQWDEGFNQVCDLYFPTRPELATIGD